MGLILHCESERVSPRFDTNTLLHNRISSRPDERTSNGDDGKIVSIILLNDDDTYMSYVVRCLVDIFEMSEPHAESSMRKAHMTGDAIVGLYSRGLAEELLGKVRKMNQANGESLEFRIVENDSD